MSLSIPNTREVNYMSVSVSLPIHVVLREIRSGKENRKKYGVPDVKMLERNKKVGGS